MSIKFAVWHNHIPHDILDRWCSYLKQLDEVRSRSEFGYPGHPLIDPPKSLHQISASIARTVMSVLRWELDVHPKYGSHYHFLEYHPGCEAPKHVDKPPALAADSQCVLSIVICLSDKEEYSGGELVLDNSTLTSTKLSKGDIAIFHSQIPHQVTKVTHGVRRVLCCFLCGPVERLENAAPELSA